MAERSAQLAIEVFVPDLSLVVDFYQSIGFVVERRVEKFAALRWYSSYLFIAEDKDATTHSHDVNIRIVVPDVDEHWTRINNLGLPVVRAIDNRDYGLRDFTIRDPAGFEVRFAGVLSDAG